VTYPTGRIASLEELECVWNFDDLMRFNDALDAIEEAQQERVKRG
jgi:hypothetical protein